MDDVHEALSSPASATPADSTVLISPLLPWEVIERVIDHSAECTTTLCSFALSCHQLHPRSSFLLFSDVHLTSRNRLFTFCDVLQARPDFRPLVRSLTIPPREFSPFPLLAILHNLQSITFDGQANNLFDPRSKFVLMHKSTLQCCRKLGQGVRSLTLTGLQFRDCTAVIRLITAFSHLEELECHDVEVQESSDSASLQAVAHYRPHQFIPLNTLTVRIVLDVSLCEC